MKPMAAFFMRQGWCFTVRYSLFDAPLEGSRIWLLATAISLMLASGVSQAAPEEPAASVSQTAEEGLRRQEEREWVQQQQLRPKADVLTPEARPHLSTTLPDETPCFVINDIILTHQGSRALSWLTDTAQPFLHSCTGIEGLRKIAATLNAKLIELGYATSRVSLPEQNLKEGRLVLRLHVGRVAAVKMVTPAAGEGEADEAWGTWRNAFPVRKGDILNIRDLEQGLEQMKRLPSQSVTTRLEPGPRADTSVITLVRQTGGLSNRLHGGITLDNSGSGTLGRTRLFGYAAFDNPLGLNDVLNLNASSNAEQPDPDHRSQSLGGSYSIPFGYNTITLTRSHSRFAQMVQGTTARFLSSGKSENAEARVHHTAFRTASAKFGIYAAVSTRRANSYLDDVELIVQRRRTTYVETGITSRKLIGNASVDVDLGYRRGVSWRDAQDDLPSAAEGGLTLRPRIWALTAAYNQPFTLIGRPFQYTTTLRGQRTGDTTLVTDQIAIGHRWSVRGFDGDSVLLAESGFFHRNDLSTPVSLISGVNTAVYLGIDHGRVWGASDVFLIGNRLAGAALGMRGTWKAAQFDAALGAPLYKPEGFKTGNWNPYLSVAYVFN